ncbi:hypothetical protein JCGZ_10975 [Jatropha curcas]|uniref:Uncharacterized protein n=1 Tax=Jatropha curcas TaxID=180498 RepID=A0A067LDV6_JATCU|nr:hypothetical protein JCGZ_10975 [Jatropha curcas]
MIPVTGASPTTSAATERRTMWLETALVVERRGEEAAAISTQGNQGLMLVTCVAFAEDGSKQLPYDCDCRGHSPRMFDLDKKLATDVPSSSKYKEKRIAPTRREKRTTVKSLFTLKNKSLKTSLCTPKSDGSSSSRSDGLQMIKTVTDNMLMTKSMIGTGCITGFNDFMLLNRIKKGDLLVFTLGVGPNELSVDIQYGKTYA